MEYLLGPILFLFGAALGSFVAVIMGRYNTGLSFIKGNSFCFSCNTRLGSTDLVPVFSYLFLKGKCRYCKDSIPKLAFISELVMGFLSLALAYKVGLFDHYQSSLFSFQSLIEYFVLILIFANILLITLYDLRHFIIPDSFLISLFVISLFYNLFFVLQGNFYALGGYFFAGIALALPFLLIFIVSKGKWIGLGDVKYIFVIAFLLGLINGISAVILAFWIGALFSVSMLILSKLNLNLRFFGNKLTIKSEIPFGPFLSIGIILSIYLNVDLLQIHFLSNLF